MIGTIKKAILLAGLSLVAPHAGALSTSYNASADTTLIGIAPTNNNGGQKWVLAGRIQNNYVNRGLFKFDVSDLPTNTVILSAVVVLEVTRVPDEPPVSSTFGLHRMLRPWGEGDNVAVTFPGQGVPADPGEATQLCAFSPTDFWSAPGAAEGSDFSGIESSFQQVSGVGTYRFEFTPELAGDVQGWVNDPESNFGWLLKSNDEGTIFTARRFGSREDSNAHPNLEIDYFVPPRIDAVVVVDGEFQLAFTPWPGQTYLVEYRDSLTSGTWHTLVDFGVLNDPSPVTATDAANHPQRYYRLIGY